MQEIIVKKDFYLISVIVVEVCSQEKVNWLNKKILLINKEGVQKKVGRLDMKWEIRYSMPMMCSRILHSFKTNFNNHNKFPKAIKEISFKNNLKMKILGKDYKFWKL